MVNRIPITSLDDPRVDLFRNVRDADLVRKACFLVEARFNVQTLLSSASNFRAASVFGTRVALDSIHDDLALLDSDLSVYEADQDTMDGVVGFHIHRGLLAAAERSEVQDAEAVLRTQGFPRVVVVVEDLTNHDNMGAIFRNAAAFGCGAVLITQRSCDPLYRKSIRVSMGHALTTPYGIIEGGHEGVGVLRGLGYRSVALTPRDGSIYIEDALDDAGKVERIAVWLGHEGKGLSEGVLSAADSCVRIPIAPHVDSLNTATALGIALHRFSAL